MTGQEEKGLEATYGPMARHSDFKRNEHIRYISASGAQLSGTIIWVQAATPAIGQRLIVAPDDAGVFLDFVVPGDVLTQDEPSAGDLTRCPWCGQLHLADQLNKCPLRPKP